MPLLEEALRDDGWRVGGDATDVGRGRPGAAGGRRADARRVLRGRALATEKPGFGEGGADSGASEMRGGSRVAADREERVEGEERGARGGDGDAPDCSLVIQMRLG